MEPTTLPTPADTSMLALASARSPSFRRLLSPRFRARRLDAVSLHRATAVLGLVAIMAIPASAQAPTDGDVRGDTATAMEAPGADDIQHWIVELGDDSFQVRSTAAERLLGAGSAAREPLVEAARSYNPEIRAAARRLLVLISQTDFQNRLDAFAADIDGKQGKTLPGWEAFRALADDDRESRELFVEMQREEGALIEKVFAPRSSDGPTEGMHSVDAERSTRGANIGARLNWEAKILRRHAWQSMNRSSEASKLGSYVTMLFLASVPEGQVSDAGAAQLGFMLQQAPLREAITTGAHRNATRRLLKAWIFNCPNKSEQVLKQRLEIAADHDVREALSLGLAVAIGDPEYLTVHPVTKALAIMLVGRFGGPQHVAHLEALLEDDSVCLQTRIVPAANANGLASAANVEVRDVALATMLHLTGQNPSDYGFSGAVRQPQRLYNLATLYMESDDKRESAAEKWRAWRSQESQADRAEPARGKSGTSS